ncbi:MAG: class I SAM-dependent methyltransferase [Candidatus Eisenbacteria bacterium]|nr:class I SAM-dependent methyltransferase [Candidatus Eisenbacteria bacterium]
MSLLDGGDCLLDVGCGCGSLALRAGERFKRVYGIDISSSRIDEAGKSADARPGGVAGLQFSVHDVNKKTSFPERMFDNVVCIAVLQYVDNPYSVVGEINRVLKPGGIFIVQVPNAAYVKYRIRLAMGKLPVTSPFPEVEWKEAGWDGGNLHYFTKSTMCNMLADCGFTVLKVTGSGLFAGWRNWWPSLLTGDLVVKARKH